MNPASAKNNWFGCWDRASRIRRCATASITWKSVRRVASDWTSSPASVKHDNIVTIHAVEDVDGVPMMVMEQIQGSSLDQRLRFGPPLDVDQVIRVAAETAAALQAAHDRGLIHRDIKPGNILLEADSGRVKVTDFGLAKTATDAPLTGSGLVAGTPEFMSPEQARDEELTPRADLFSLGVVLYALLAGVLAGIYWHRPPDELNRDVTPGEVRASSDGFHVGQPLRHFAQLGDAIQAAAASDVIEVVGNGPFLVPGFDLADKRLTIRAAPGSTPLLISDATDGTSERACFRAHSDLRLEGLEIRWRTKVQVGQSIEQPSDRCIVFVEGGALELSRCRLLAGSMTACVAVNAGGLRLDRCNLAAQSSLCAVWNPGGDAELKAENCVFEGRTGLVLNAATDSRTSGRAAVQLVNNTFVTARALQILFDEKRIKYGVEASRNAFDVSDLIVLTPTSSYRTAHRPLTAPQARTLLKSFLAWTDTQNAYRRNMSFLGRGTVRAEVPARRDVLSLAEWLAMWEAESTSGSFEADYRFKIDDTPVTDDGPRTYDVHATIEGFPANVGADASRVGPDAAVN